KSQGRMFPPRPVSVDTVATRRKDAIRVERPLDGGAYLGKSLRMSAKQSSLSEYPANTGDGWSHVEALSSALTEFGKGARKAIDQANDLGDLDTADLFTEVSHGIDKWPWFVEEHRQTER